MLITISKTLRVRMSYFLLVLIASVLESRSQSPRYPYTAAGTGNNDLWDEAFRHDRIIGLPMLLRMCASP